MVKAAYTDTQRVVHTLRPSIVVCDLYDIARTAVNNSEEVRSVSERWFLRADTHAMSMHEEASQ